MGYSIENDRVPSGFYRGELAGLDPEERLKRQSSARHGWGARGGGNRLLARRIPTPPWSYHPNPLTKGRPEDPLKTVLEGCPASDLRTVAQRLGGKRKPPRYKAEVVSLLAKELPASPGELLGDLADADPNTLSIVERCLSGETVSTPGGLPYLLPHVFTRGTGQSAVSFMPWEVREAYDGVDLGPLRERACEREAICDFVTSHVVLCGVAPLGDVFAHYVGLHPQTRLDAQEFLGCVKGLAENPTTTFFLLERDGVTFVLHDRLQAGWHHGYETEAYGRRLPADGFRPEAMRQTLIERHGEIDARPMGLDDDQLERAADIYRLPCVLALTEYFDAHVPRDEDELRFADRMMDILVESVMMRGASLDSVIWWLTCAGWYLAEGTNTAPRLTRLVIDLFEELPRWGFNGWSEREFRKRAGLSHLVSETCLERRPPQAIDEVIPPNDIVVKNTAVRGSYDEGHYDQVPSECYEDYPF